MMICKPLDKQHEWDWVKSRAHCIQCEDSCGIVCVTDSGEIAAVCVFDSFTTVACNGHMAIDNPLCIRYGFFHEIARYLFTVCGRNRMFALVPDNNVKALKLNKHIGMKNVCSIPGAISEEVGYELLSLEKEGCKWLPQVEEAA